MRSVSCAKRVFLLVMLFSSGAPLFRRLGAATLQLVSLWFPNSSAAGQLRKVDGAIADILAVYSVSALQAIGPDARHHRTVITCRASGSTAPTLTAAGVSAASANGGRRAGADVTTFDRRLICGLWPWPSGSQAEGAKPRFTEHGRANSREAARRPPRRNCSASITCADRRVRCCSRSWPKLLRRMSKDRPKPPDKSAAGP